MTPLLCPLAHFQVNPSFFCSDELVLIDAAAVFNKSGSPLVQSLSLDGAVKAEAGNLVVHVQNGPDEPELLGDRPSVVGLNGSVSEVTVEQEGPVRAVIKVRTFLASSTAHSNTILGDWEILGRRSRRLLTLYGALLRIGGFDFSADCPLLRLRRRPDQGFHQRTWSLFHSPAFRPTPRSTHPFRVHRGRDLGRSCAYCVGSAPRRDSRCAHTSVRGHRNPSIVRVARQCLVRDQRSTRMARLHARSAVPGAFYCQETVVGWPGLVVFGSCWVWTQSVGIGICWRCQCWWSAFRIQRCVRARRRCSLTTDRRLEFWQGAPRGLDIRNAGGDTASVTLWAYSPRVRPDTGYASVPSDRDAGSCHRHEAL